MKSYSNFLVWMSMVLVALFMLSVAVIHYDAGILLVTAVGGLVTVIGSWLTLDMSAVIRLTTSAPAGKFFPADAGKYIRAVIGLAVLILIGIIMQGMNPLYNFQTPMAILVGGTFGIISIYVGGMKLNKKATGASGGDYAEGK